MALYPLLPNKMLVNRTDQGILYYQYEKDGRTYFLASRMCFTFRAWFRWPDRLFADCHGEKRHRHGHCDRRIRGEVLCQRSQSRRSPRTSGRGQRANQSSGQLERSIRGAATPIGWRCWKRMKFQSIGIPPEQGAVSRNPQISTQ